MRHRPNWRKKKNPRPNTPKNLLNHLLRSFCHYFQIGSWNLIWITLSTICQSNRLLTSNFRDKMGQDSHPRVTGVPNILSRIVSALFEKKFKQILEHRLDQVTLRAFNERQNEPPFSPEQLRPFIKLSWMSFT